MQLTEHTYFGDGNRYHLEKLLGRGGFSEVWLVKDSITELELVLKVYAPGTGMDEDGLKTFSKELANVYNLNHQNLLKPQHVDSWQGMPYLVMSYCPQGSLVKRIGKIPENEIRKVIHDVASGLAYLHERDIIHQDIKPDNILVDDMGNYVITDFGISTRARSTLRKSVAASSANSGGTIAYMGPERFSKQPAPTKASDIWSLGATLFELLEGDAPFGNLGGGLQKGGAEIPEITADVSDTLKNVIYSMLAKDTWDRPTAAQVVEWVDDSSSISIEHPQSSNGRMTQRIDNKESVHLTTEESADTSSNNSIIPKRHWFVTTWLVLVSALQVLCLFALGYYQLCCLIDSFRSSYNGGIYLMAWFFYLLGAVFFVSMWRNSRKGYWCCLISWIIPYIPWIAESKYFFGWMGYYADDAPMLLCILSLLSCAIVFFIKRDGISAWQRFNYGSQKIWKPKSWISVTIASLMFVLVVVVYFHKKNKVEQCTNYYELRSKGFDNCLSKVKFYNDSNDPNGGNIDDYTQAYYALRDLQKNDRDYVKWSVIDKNGGVNDIYDKKEALQNELNRDYQKMQKKYQKAVRGSAAEQKALKKCNELKNLIDLVDQL